MKYIKYLAYCISAYVIVAAFTSCCKACNDDKPEIILSFDKYRKYEVDSIVEVRYQSNTNFSVLIDSIVTIRDWYSQDTTYTAGDFFSSLPVGAEYIIKLPSVGKTFAFSDYQINQRECGCSNKKIIDELSSFTMNGNVVRDFYVELPR